MQPPRALYRRSDLARLLEPQSIAIVGASARAGSFGERTQRNLSRFGGRVHLVNARYDRLGDQPCFPNLAALPESPDLVVIAAPYEAAEGLLRDCVAARAGAVVLYAAGFAETGKPERAELQRRVASIAQEGGVRLVGPNCIGVLDYRRMATISFAGVPFPPEPIGGPAVGIVSQSGNLGFALAQAVERGAAVSRVLACGNSADVDVADLVAALAEDPGCDSIACLFEGMREPRRLLEAARIAWEHDKPLVIHKLATGEAGAEAALSHTGSLAGSHAAYRAAFEREGAILAESWEALLETAAFLAKAPARPRAPGVAVVSTSGGAAIMAADRAEEHGVPMPQPEENTLAVLRAHIPEFGAARNPCDITAQVLNDPESLRACAEALFADPNYGAMILPNGYAYDFATPRFALFGEYARTHGKPTCLVWLTQWLEGPGAREAERNPDVAVFRSMDRCIAALKAWQWRAGHRVPESAGRASPDGARGAAAKLLAGAAGATLTEREAKRVLAAYGVPVVEERLVSSAEEAVAAAEAAGYPVVLKVESPDLPHKTEAGVIRLGLRDAAAVREGFAAVMANAARVSPAPRINGVLVQPMIPAGLELVVGARRDPLFGPTVVVGLGGVLVELLRDTAVALAPVGVDEARAMLGRLRGAKLLEGFRNLPAVDLGRLAEVVARVSELAAEHDIAEIDVNPLICAGERIVAVDALIVTAPPGG